MLVNISQLNVDESYQRPVKSHAKRLARDFRPEAAGPLLVAKRPCGALYIIDGRQRATAMESRGITQWDAKVVDSTGPEYEATLFAIVNGGQGTTRGLTTRELFKAQLSANDPFAIASVRAVEAGGLKLSLTGGTVWPSLVCTKSVYRMVVSHGEEVVKRACHIIAQSWPMSNDAMRDCIFLGVATFIVHHPEKDDEKIISKFSKAPSRWVLQESASTNGQRHLVTYRVLLKLFNKRKTFQTKAADDLRETA